ncbi:40S ribosomal protein S4-like [Schistocerca gregaria]|uniref:40S ribosomal protein S4-like n=1 Tax=Schistocerca gregaria TaxID=7010 RepID=UPI00211E87C0|nr:40S ribosomal protein S4-like [Schistocerca gregaria]
MARGPKHHLKRLAAPKHWMLGKLGGIWAPRPSPGPHKLRECLPLILLLRNRLHYALNRQEVIHILNQRLISVDKKVRTDPTYPAGFMDVVEIERTDERFRLLYDTKGRFCLHRISEDEVNTKLCRVRKVALGWRGIPYIGTNDGRVFRYPHPDIKVNDVVVVDLVTNTIKSYIKFSVGNICMTTGGHNIGRIGIIIGKEEHTSTQDIIKIRDTRGETWATKISNVFILGNGNQPQISLPQGKGIKLSAIEDREVRLKKQQH